MTKGYKHKEDCKCKWCTGESGFHKGVDHKGKNNSMFGVNRKGKCPWISIKNKKYPGTFLGKHHSEEAKQKSREKHLNPSKEIRIRLRVARQNQILKNGGGPNKGKNEDEALNQIEKLFQIKIIRQYPIEGFFVDGYCKEKNIVFEIDERGHKNKRKKDWIRENIIKNKLNCKIVRIKDYDD